MPRHRRPHPPATFSGLAGRLANDVFSSPVLFANINEPNSCEESVTVSADGRLVIFASDRTGWDLYYSLLGPSDPSFPPPAKLPVVNGTTIEVDPFLSPCGEEEQQVAHPLRSSTRRRAPIFLALRGLSEGDGSRRHEGAARR